jgi:surfeit locus 1 family protein
VKGNAERGKGEGAPVGVMLLLIMAAALCTELGRWQLERAREQKRMEASSKAALAMEELNLGSAAVTGKDAFRRASADGIYDPAQQFYLDNRRVGDRLGYHVITAMRLVGTRRYVLVNRGWMSQDQTVAPVPAGRVHVSGVLAKAQLPGLLLGQPHGTTRPWLDPAAYAAESGRPVEPLILVASGDSTSLVPGGVERPSREAMHLGYALQWFSFAVMAAVAVGVIAWRRVRDGR